MEIDKVIMNVGYYAALLTLSYGLLNLSYGLAGYIAKRTFRRGSNSTGFDPEDFAAVITARHYEDSIDRVAAFEIARERGERFDFPILFNQDLLDRHFRKHPGERERLELKLRVRKSILTDRVIDAEYMVIS